MRNFGLECDKYRRRKQNRDANTESSGIWNAKDPTNCSRQPVSTEEFDPAVKRSIWIPSFILKMKKFPRNIGTYTQTTMHQITWQNNAALRLSDAFWNWREQTALFINLLKTKRNLLYIRNQSVPRCKHFPPRL